MNHGPPVVNRPSNSIDSIPAFQALPSVHAREKIPDRFCRGTRLNAEVLLPAAPVLVIARSC